MEIKPRNLHRDFGKRKIYSNFINKQLLSLSLSSEYRPDSLESQFFENGLLQLNESRLDLWANALVGSYCFHMQNRIKFRKTIAKGATPNDLRQSLAIQLAGQL